MTRASMMYINLHTLDVQEPQKLTPGWQKLIGLSQKGTFRIPLFKINPKIFLKKGKK